MHTSTDALTPEAPAILVTVDDAARMLGVGKSTLYGYVKSGDLTLLHHGRRSTIAVTELHHLVNRLAHEAGVPLDRLTAVGQ